MTGARTDRIGAVLIGRNEGERLRRCLESVTGSAGALVYVDSGSTDGSVEMARAAGADVVALDMDRPFTAARARNEGFRRLAELCPGAEYVQFVDGDCEIAAGWIERASAELDEQPGVAAVCGRRRERFPGRSIYNRLCDIEWDTRVGEAESCGGDVLMRAAAFREAGGYHPGLIAGEEPELCFRLRGLGWKILRIDGEMTLHDAAMTRFGQWWKRTLRAGHAYAENAWNHGTGPERFKRREVRSNLAWGLAFPAGIAGCAAFVPWVLLGLAVYPLQAGRIALRKKRDGLPVAQAVLYGVFCMLGKFPLALGFIKFHKDRLLRKTSVLIEYK